MYIHIEGLDLTGKTTVCKRLKQRLGNCSERHNSLADDNPLYKLVDESRKKNAFPPADLGWMYYAAMLADFNLYQPPTGTALQDSTILLRSLAFHQAKGTDAHLVDRFICATERHPRFTVTFVLKSTREKRIERLAKRRPENLGPEDFLVRDQPEVFYRMEELLTDYATKYFQAQIIDTTDLEDQQASDRIIDDIIRISKERANKV